MTDHAATFDHLIHWVDDVDAVMAGYESLGLPTHQALTMPGFRNAAWGVDDERYVELAAVDDWDAARTSDFGASLEVLKPAVQALEGPGPVTFAVNVPDARASAARLRELGREVDEVEILLDEQNAGFVEVFVRDAPSFLPFLISYDPPRAELARMRAEYRAKEGISLEGRPDLAALLVRSTEPEADAQLLGEFLGCEVAGTTVALPGAEVRFETGSPTGLYGIAVRGLDPARGQDLDAAPGPAEVAGMTIVSEG